MSKKSFFILLIAVSFSLVAYLASSHSVASADEEQEFPKLAVNAGVWNGGQAALWDLHLFDYLRYFGAPERARGYRPEQPIAFSHVRHVKLNGMECQYCHWSPTKSTYTNYPEVEACMGCHKSVAGQTEEQQKEIRKIHGYWDNSGGWYVTKEGKTVDEEGDAVTVTGESSPIPWEKVHVMPNYIKFNHKRHVKAGMSCHSCHGQLQEMEVVERVSSMKMGWCLSCHRDNGVSIDCATCHY
ncbi:MAG: cytochrome c3 family protein [Bdellovibrionales bacterium]|nr:cytochrome c3 family protein [Bdellovibrionales bacterium]